MHRDGMGVDGGCPENGVGVRREGLGAGSEVRPEDGGDGTDDISVAYYSSYLDATNCLVPDHHIPILVMVVQWKTAAERLFTELQGPDTNHIITGHILAR